MEGVCFEVAVPSRERLLYGAKTECGECWCSEVPGGVR